MRIALRALGFSAALLIFPAVAGAATTVAGHARVAIDSASHTADFSATARVQSVVVLHEWERTKMEALKRENPRITVLMYKNLAFMQTRDGGGNASTGVTTQDAAGHPEWYLLDPGGSRLVPWGYSWLYAGDVGNRGYQERWAANAIAATRDGWDGIFMDDTNPTMKYHFDIEQLAKYPTDAAYSAAVGSALSLIGPRIQAAGKLVVPNFGSWSGYRSTVDGWLQYVSGGMEEQFAKWGLATDVGRVTGADWERQLGALRATQSQHKLFIGISHSQAGDDGAARYGWATMLLGADGSAAYALAADYTNETWFPEYDYDLGAPTSAAVESSRGVYRRSFAGGLVLVNPTDQPVTVDFGAAYSGSGLASETGTTMAPATGLVLLRDGAAPTDPPAPTTAEPAPTLPVPPAPADSPAVPDPAPGPADTPATPATPAGDELEPVASPPPAPRSKPRRKRRARSVRVQVRCGARRIVCRSRVTVRLRSRITVGRRVVHVRPGNARTVRVELDPRGRRALAARKPLKVTITRLGV